MNEDTEAAWAADEGAIMAEAEYDLQNAEWGEHPFDPQPNPETGQFDYLMQNTDKNVLKNLAQMGEHMKKLRSDMLAKEAEYEQAKKEYEYYAGSVLPMEMFNAGVQSLELMSGGRLCYERKFYCSPNKNDEDKRIMAEWLRANAGGHLIKEKAIVDAAQIEKLKAAKVPFIEIDDINTNSLKAFLKDKIGAGKGVAQIQITEIPACMHFQEAQQVTIEA